MEAQNRGPIHDTLLFYTASDDFTWNAAYQEYDEDYARNFYRYTRMKEDEILT